MSLFYRLSRRGLQIFFKIFYRHKVYVPKGISYPEGAILASNHASFFDPPLVAISWHEPIHFLANSYLFKNPLLNLIITNLNAQPVGGSSDLAAMKLSCTLLQEGKKILIFPEGTRSKNGEIAPFKKGVGMLANRVNSPIIPVYIHGAHDVWPPSKKLPTLFGKKTACVFGKPIYIEEFSELNRKEIQQAIADRIHLEVSNLKNWYLSGAKGTL